MPPVRVNHDYIVGRLIYPDLRNPIGLLCNTFRPFKVLGLCPANLWQLTELWCIRQIVIGLTRYETRLFMEMFSSPQKNKFYGLCHAQSTVEELNLDTPYCADCNLLFYFLLNLTIIIIYHSRYLSTKDCAFFGTF